MRITHLNDFNRDVPRLAPGTVIIPSIGRNGNASAKLRVKRGEYRYAWVLIGVDGQSFWVWEMRHSEGDPLGVPRSYLIKERLLSTIWSGAIAVDWST